MTSSSPLPEYTLALTQVGLSINGKKIFEEISFSAKPGEFIYLTGKNGAGKSSLLRLLYADLRPDTGVVQVGEFEVQKLRPAEVPYLRRKLGIVFQDFQLLPDLSVYANLEFVLKATGWYDRQAIRNRITEVLMMVGLSEKMELQPYQLSGGEQQRVVIARAMLNSPFLLIADEPTGNLDAEATAHVMKLLRDIAWVGTTVLVVTHDEKLFTLVPGRLLRLEDGRLLEYPNT
jgi:cell division transport system ATP-binding protein